MYPKFTRGVTLTALFTLPSFSQAATTLTVINSTDWRVNNGIVTADFNPTNFTFTKIAATLAGNPYTLLNAATPLPALLDHGSATPALYTQPITNGLAFTPVPVPAYTIGNGYVDIYTTAADPATSFSIQHHYLFKDNDPGVHFFAVANQAPSATPMTEFATGYTTKFTVDSLLNYYEVNPGPNSLGTFSSFRPNNTIQHDATYETYDGGLTHPRNVQKETTDLTGLTNPDGSPVTSTQTYQLDNGLSGTITRKFITKYDWQSYHQFQVANGIYNNQIAAWTVYSSGGETETSGPTGQELGGNNAGPFLQIAFASNHNGNSHFNPPANVATQRVFGTVYMRFNAFDSTHTTTASLYQDAATSATSFNDFYDNNPSMLAAGYTPTAKRSQVLISAANNSGWGSKPYDNVFVLADNKTNFNTSNVGYQYWDYLNTSGKGAVARVIPGTYRLSLYQIGQWGELRVDNVTIGQAQNVKIDNLQFTPENFGTAPPIFAIGTPDRSAHEFLYGHDGHDNGPDLRNYNSYDYWGDLVKNFGVPKVVYYATAVGSHPATNNVNLIPMNQYKTFNPNIFAQPYNPADTTQNGYKYITAQTAPAIGSPATFTGSPWEFHFTTTQAQLDQGHFIVLSVAIAAEEASLIASLNGHPLTWHSLVKSDPMVRSGVAGRGYFAVFQWDTSFLTSPGLDNLLTFDVSQPLGIMYDAFRLEITNSSANPTLTGWHDYEFITAGTDIPANDTLAANHGSDFTITPIPIPEPATLSLLSLAALSLLRRRSTRLSVQHS